MEQLPGLRAYIMLNSNECNNKEVTNTGNIIHSVLGQNGDKSKSYYKHDKIFK